MKIQNPQDERVVNERRKINSEAYGILMIVLLCSVLVQQFLLNAPFEQYAVEIVGFIGMSVYILIRQMSVGHNLFGDGKRAKYIPIINSIVTGSVVTAVNGVLNFMKYGDKYKADGIGYFLAMLAFTFISATLGTYLVLAVLNFMNQKKQERIQHQLDLLEESE